MIKSDFHTHTGFSDDCEFPMYVMIQAAIDQGIECLAITDHYDPDYPDRSLPFDLDLDKYIPALDAASERYEGRIEIAKGIELGIRDGSYDKCNAAVAMTDFDVVIGSFHAYRDRKKEKDIAISVWDFSDRDMVKFLEDFYIYMYECLRAYKNYDILGHFSIMDRYSGGLRDYEPYKDIIDEILKLMIVDGKALEINTSSYAYKMECSLPRESILRRYRELGGNMITFGSDAHAPYNLRSHFDEAGDLARSLGFRSYCTFKGRKPLFHSL